MCLDVESQSKNFRGILPCSTVYRLIGQVMPRSRCSPHFRPCGLVAGGSSRRFVAFPLKLAKTRAMYLTQLNPARSLGGWIPHSRRHSVDSCCLHNTSPLSQPIHQYLHSFNITIISESIIRTPAATSSVNPSSSTRDHLLRHRHVCCRRRQDWNWQRR